MVVKIVRFFVRQFSIDLFFSLLLFSIPLFYKSYTKLGLYYNQSVFFIAASIYSLSTIFYLLSKRNFKINIKIIDLITILFLTLLFFSTNDYENLLIKDDNVNLIAIIAIYISFRITFCSRTTISSFFYIALIGGLIVELTGFLQLFNIVNIKSNSQFSVTGPFDNPNIYTCYLVMLLPLAHFVSNAPPMKGHLSKAIRAGGKIYIIAAIFLSFYCLSRVSIVISLFLLILMNYSYIKRTYKYAAIILISCCLFLASVLIFKTKTDSSRGRLLILKISSKMIISSPFQGNGYGEFKNQYNNYQAKYFATEKSTFIERKVAGETFFPFNEYLKILIENGVLGLAAFFLLIYCVLMPENTVKDQVSAELRYSLVLSIISILAVGLFSYPFGETSILVYLFCLFALTASLNNKSLCSFNFSLLGKLTLVIIYLFVLLICSFRSNILHRWIRISSKEISDKNSSKCYEDIYPFLKENGHFTLEYGERLLNHGHFVLSANILERSKKNLSNIFLYLELGNVYRKLNKMPISEKYYLHASNIAPNRFVPRYVLFNFYKDTGQIDKMNRVGMEILTMPVKVLSPQVNAIKSAVYYQMNYNSDLYK